MGYFREIIAYQHPRIKETQLVNLVKDLKANGWLFQGRTDNDNLTYTINSGDWIQLEGNETDKLFSDLSSLTYENSFGGMQLKHPEFERILWVYQYEGKYRFELQISRDENEIHLFNQYFKKLQPAIENLKHILHIEWRTHYSNDVVRRMSNVSHAGVLIIASSKRLKEYYSNNKFNYDFPVGIKDLIDKKIIIAINCLDYDFETILETEKFTRINDTLVSSIEFKEEDELLILNHSQFTMICHYNEGDYSKHGDLITPIQIESPGIQKMSFARSKENYDGEMIIQFNNNEKRNTVNRLIEIDEIPTHNSR